MAERMIYLIRSKATTAKRFIVTEDFQDEQVKSRLTPDEFIDEVNTLEGRLGGYVMFLSEEGGRAPEGCKLVAHDTGDGWYLGVEDDKGNEVAMLNWPKAWPDSMSASRLREIGFEVV